MKTDFGRIYVMMGTACNFNCVYCSQSTSQQGIQKTECRPHISKRPSKEFLDYMKRYGEALDVTNLKRKPTIAFWGGEPLLYFDTIKQVIDVLGENVSKFRLGTVTNGELITDEMVDFFNKNHVVVNLSHDGPKTVVTRGKDVLKSSIIRDRFHALNSVTFHTVISGVTQDLYRNWDYFAEMGFPENENTSYMQMMVYPYDGIPDYLLKFDLVKWEETLQKVVASLYKSFLENNGEVNVRSKEFQVITHQLGSLYRSNYEHFKATGEVHYCQTATKMLAVDVQGKTYFCHNSSKEILPVYDPNFDSLYAGLAEDMVCKTMKDSRDYCRDCEYGYFCTTSCPLPHDKSKAQTLCGAVKLLCEYVRRYFHLTEAYRGNIVLPDSIKVPRHA